MMNSNRPIGELLAQGRPIISVEFFPPKDDQGGEQIVHAAEEIREHLHPDFVSITYGAGGTTRERTYRYARILKDEYGFQVMPHLTCVGSSRNELKEIISNYRDAGFCNIMALRGDPPKGESQFVAHPDGLPYARDLVAFIRNNYSGFSIGVAGYPEVHPESPSPELDLKYLKDKVDAGASFITTQLFYDNRSFLDFIRKCRAAGIKVPIIPGLMPLRSISQAHRFCQNIPAQLEESLSNASSNPQAIQEIGVDWTVRQISELMDHGIQAFHMYIMNRSGMALEVIKRLRQSGRL